MKGHVTRLCDIDSIAIPEEMLKISVDEKEIDSGIDCLSLRYATESEATDVEKDDIVYCRADSESYPDKRTVILFTGTPIPGAEKAACDVLGKKLNDSFDTTLCGRKATLTVEKIIRRTKSEISDTLIASLNIDGVTSVDDYREYLRNKKLSTLKTENIKYITAYLLDQMVLSCEYDYDESTLEEYVNSELEVYKADCEQFGEEYDADGAREAIISNVKQKWIAKAFCQSKGIDIDISQVEEEADRMIEMMTLMGEDVPEREEAVELVLEDEYMMSFFNYMETAINEKMEAANGNG